MKIALLGATGTLGQRILSEAVRRGHAVTALSRHPGKLTEAAGVHEASVDATKADSIAQAVKDHQAVISAIGPGYDGKTPPDMLKKVATALIDGLRRTNIKRLLVVSGAGSLEVAPGVRLVDSPDFPAEYKSVALAHAEALDVFKPVNDLEWTCFSPAAEIAPGKRTGKYRRGTEQLLVDEKGRSNISAEDFAVALLDELERPSAIQKRITVAY